MMPPFTRIGFSVLIVASFIAATMNAAFAQTTRTWTTTAPTGDSGNWSDASKWSGANVPDTAGESATFGSYDNARTITVDGTAYTINKLIIQPRTSLFVSTNFTLNASGGGSLAIGAGGIDIYGGNVVSINAPIEVTANQTWNALNGPAGSATFTGIISGIGKITRTSTGGTGSLFRFNGANTFSGGYEQAAGNSPTTILGVSSTVTSGAIASGPLGTVTLNGGTLRGSDNATARTLHNNIVIGGPVTFGTSSNNAALTFSDAGLTTASTFTLGSSVNDAVNIIRTGNTALTFDQVIAESGGIGQSVLFSATAGTPTVTLGRTKTAGGNLLVGGVSLVLANGTANSGSLLAVNGSVTATGANKFSTGALISDGAGLAATDATNYSAVSGGKATVYNNGRVSFATTQSQATIAGLLTSDSQIRLGLGSGSGNATITENYDQSALGNGRAGLVSGTTGILTYNGTLTAGSDSAYRVGGGLGTLALGSALTGTGNALRVEGGGTVTNSVNHTYTGATTLSGVSGYTGGSTLTNGVFTLSGANGALSGTSGITLINGAVLNLETGGTGNNRINNSASVSLNSGYMLFNNAATTAAFSETMGDFIVNAGANQLNFRTTPAANTIRTVQFGSISRNNNAVLLVRGDALGGTVTARNEIKFTSSPTLVGGGGAAGTVNQSIVPWMRGAFDGAIVSGPGRFTTYDSNGLRTLSPVNEMVQASATTQIDTAIGSNTDRNVRWNPNSAGNANLLATASTTATVNALWIGNSGTNAATTYSLNSGTINVTSGAVHLQHDATQNFTVNGGTLAFGTAEAVISSNSGGGFLNTLGAAFTGNGGLSIYALSGGGIQLNGANNITGTFTLGGNGFIGVDQDARFGNAANSVVHGGGELRFFAGFTTTRGLTLLGNVGDNTLGNNNTSGQTVTWNGDISGAGRLRLTNNNGANGINGFTLGGNNSYTGGTQIEGIAVTGSSNNAFGSGTVTLQSANNNAAGLALTSAAPTLGGLRGSDGTVTINPSAPNATLTVGANNDSTVFHGVITQGSGKTGALTKTGTGTLIFTNSHTYTGGTTISGGTLVANNGTGTGSGSATGGGSLTVGSGARLGGSGTVGSTSGGSSFTVQSGCTLFAGQSGVRDAQELTVRSNGMITLGGKVELDIIGGASSGVLNPQADNNDRLIFTPASGSAGTATPVITGSLQINSNLTGWAAGSVFDLFDWTDLTTSFSNLPNSGSMEGNPIDLPDLGNPTLRWNWSNLYTTGQLAVVVPEPSRAMSLLLGIGMWVFKRRRSQG